MLYTSPVFWMVVLLAFAACQVANRRVQNWIMLLASVYLYGREGWINVPILLFSASVDFLAGPIVLPGQAKWKRVAGLAASISINIGLLAYFKYANFIFAEVLPLFHFQTNTSDFFADVIFPLGISFYTFQAMSYTIDCYRGKLQPCRTYSDYLLYITFFPQLVAGPIERASKILPQFYRERRVEWADFRAGALLIGLGLFRKFYVADGLAAPVEFIFTDPLATGPEIFLGSWLMAVRVYFDFAAYSDLGRGVAKFFGIDLSINFKQVWSATNPTQFWERWNITTGKWFRDYVLIPIGGNGESRLTMARNMIFMFVLIGFWHGASWSWLAWGAFHGVLVAAYRDLRKHHPALLAATPGFVGIIFIQLVVLAGGGLFHAAGIFSTLPAVLHSLTTSWTVWAGAGAIAVHVAPLLIPGIAIDLLPLRVREFFTTPQFSWAMEPAALAILMGTAFFLSGGDVEPTFIYFKF